MAAAPDADFFARAFESANLNPLSSCAISLMYSSIVDSHKIGTFLDLCQIQNSQQWILNFKFQLAFLVVR